MQRRQLFEFEDLAWFPASFRNVITGWLQDLILTQDHYEPTVGLLEKLLDASGRRSIVDVCSGAGGPWRRLKGQLEAVTGPVELLFTDKFPNQPALGETCRAIGDGRTRFHPGSVDATDLTPELSGATTMFSAFHHLPPSVARRVLAAAMHRRQAIGIFDITSRASVPGVIRYVPISAVAWLHRLRPRRWYHVAFTYLLPVLPLAITWDAIASNVRAYEVEDLHALTGDLRGEGWRWEIGEVSGTHSTVTYVLGLPIP